jgi:hypothetical protein
MPDMEYVTSSNIDQIGYDADQQELHVLFRGGGLYIYTGVPPHIYEGLQNAASKGSYLNIYLKDAYSYIRG